MEYVAAHTRLLREPVLCQLADWVVINVSYSSGKWILKLCGQETFVFVYHYEVQTSDALDPWWGPVPPPPPPPYPLILLGKFTRYEFFFFFLFSLL